MNFFFKQSYIHFLVPEHTSTTKWHLIIYLYSNTTKEHIFVIYCRFKKLILFNILILRALVYKHSNMIQRVVQSV